MGNSNSSNNIEDDDAADNLDPFNGIDTLGYRVLGVQPNSPASKAGLVSFLDFLVGANQRMLLGSGEDLQEGEEYDDIDLPALLEEHKNQPIEFLVYNIKSQQSRLVELTPSDSWGGAGLLGVTIRLDNYAGAENRLVRVLTVAPKSPADLAGLVPLKDFLLGTTHQTMDSTETLAAVLQQYQDTVVEIYVYNCDADKVRVVALMPTFNWGGRGLLGAEVGVGYLHRLPASVCATEGASVERKVRYVGVGSNNSSNKTGASNGKSRSSDRLLPQLSNSQGTEPLMVEVTPQLEMEAEPCSHSDDEDDSSVEDMTSVSLRSQRSTASTEAAVHQGEGDSGERDHAKQQTPLTPMTSIKAGKEPQVSSPMTPATPAIGATIGADTPARSMDERPPPADIFAKPAPSGNFGLPPPPKRTAAT
ncbi:hypothetical protein MPSEU_000034800 [Mayamaea pseudoterrestris]|nr:hypothetical protein MPSEU_000034800 [Mayamaea pseudoterrestris]